MADPLNHETPPPPPRNEGPFWPKGWKAAELAFLSAVIFGGFLADDYLKALGWSL